MPEFPSGRLALLVGFALLAGCYRYTPVAPASLEPGTTVRVELDDHGTAEMARWIGPGGTSLQGRVQLVSDTALRLSVTDVVRRNGSTEPWKGEPVVLPNRLASSVAVRRLDRRRTILTSVGALAALVAADAAFGKGGGLFGLGGHNSGARR